MAIEGVLTRQKWAENGAQLFGTHVRRIWSHWIVESLYFMIFCFFGVDHFITKWSLGVQIGLRVFFKSWGLSVRRPSANIYFEKWPPHEMFREIVKPLFVVVEMASCLTPFYTRSCFTFFLCPPPPKKKPTPFRVWMYLDLLISAGLCFVCFVVVSDCFWIVFDCILLVNKAIN